MNILYGLTHWRETAAYILTKCHFLPDDVFLKLKYRLVFRKKLNLENPGTFNEKLQWLKLYNRCPQYTQYVDKYSVREFVSNKIGDKYLIPLLGVWDTVSDIEFDKLPRKFVIKCTHDSGSVVLCKDKDSFDQKACVSRLSKKMGRSLYWWGREWPYKNLKPRIIAEALLEDAESQDLKDYKFFCFNGKVHYFKVDFNRFVNHRANYYDVDKNLLPFEEVDVPRDPNANVTLPNTIHQMISLAEVLAEGMPFVRVDFYDVNGSIYFGEMTFFPAAGFGVIGPDDWDRRIGDLLILPEKGK